MKLLARDIDGTFVFSDEKGNKYVREEDIKAIKEFRAAGNLFGVCTGRGFASHHEGYDVPIDFAITNSGACIFYPDGKEIDCQTISKTIVKDIMQDVKDAWYIIFQDRSGMYVMGKELPNGHTITSLDEIKGDRIDGFGTIFNDEATASKYCQLIKDKYGDKVAVYQNINSFDTQALGCSKGIGLQKVAKHFNADAYYCIGDSFNDMAMLEVTKNSYTFHHSPEVVRKIAGHCVNSLAECIEDIMKD